MKSFKEYINEETMPFAQTDKGFIGVEDSAVRDNINSLLSSATAKSFVTPYIALERVAKVLANFHIFLPKYTFMEGDSGTTVFPVNQFGEKIGATEDGRVVTAPESEYFIFFEYQLNDEGMFEIFTSIVDQDELDEIMADIEDEEEDDEEKDLDEGYVFENYHSSYSDAIQTAVAHAKKRGYEVDPDDYHNKVSSGPRKPSEGKTVSHNLKLTKNGKPSKKGLAIQVYNRGGDKTPYELNHYISEENITEVSKKLLGNYLSKKNMEKGRPGKKAKSMELAIGKMVNNPNYKKVKVPATNEETQIDELSQETLRNYHAKAASNLKVKRQKLDRGTLTSKDLKQGQNRVKGLNRSAKKMDEEQIDEISRDLASRYIKKAKESSRDAYYGSDAPTSGKRKKGIDLALKKKWGDKNYGLPEPKVKATNESSNPAKEGMIAAGYKGSNPAEQGSIAVKKDDEAREKKLVKKKK